MEVTRLITTRPTAITPAAFAVPVFEPAPRVRRATVADTEVNGQAP